MVKPSQLEIEDFSFKIMSLARENRLDYIDAILHYCESSGLEIEVAAKLITPSVKQQIESEALKFNLIEKYPVLPI